MIDPGKEIHCRQLSRFVAREADIGVHGGTLARRVLVFGVTEHQGNRRIQRQRAGRRQCGIARRHAVAEAAARRIADDPHLFLGQPNSRGHLGDVAVQVLPLALDDHAPVLRVSQNDIRLHRQMRLPRRAETSLNRMGGMFQKPLRVLALVDGLFHIDVGGVFMDRERPFRSGFHEGHDGGKRLVFHPDPLRSGPRLVPARRRHNGHHVPIPAYHPVTNDRAIEAVAQAVHGALRRNQPVRALYVLRGNNVDDAGHGLGFGGVQSPYPGMFPFRQNNRQMQRAFRHLSGNVGPEVACPEYPGKRRGLREIRTVQPTALRRGKGDVLHRLFPAHHGGGLHHGVHDGLVSGTAADVAVPGKPFPDLFPRRIRIAHQKPFGRHDEPRRTEAALHARIRHERPLQRMKPFRRAEALDGFDFRIRLDLFHLFDAGARDLPVEQQRTSAAVPGSAPDFRPGEPKTPHHVGKGVLLRLTKDFPIYPIDVQDDSLNGHGSSSVKGLDIFQTRRIALLSRKLERKAIRLRRASSGTAVLQRTGATCPRNP